MIARVGWKVVTLERKRGSNHDRDGRTSNPKGVRGSPKREKQRNGNKKKNQSKRRKGKRRPGGKERKGKNGGMKGRMIREVWEEMIRSIEGWEDELRWTHSSGWFSRKMEFVSSS